LILSLTRPTDRQIQEFIDQAAHQRLSYAEVGATRTNPPTGYTVDHHRSVIGRGEAAFNRAIAAMRAWRPLRLGWVMPGRDDTPIEAGADVAVVVRTFGVWSLNACRIVYTIDERGAAWRFGFAYGTLEQHAESGEERFTVEWRRDDDSVRYDIVAFSRPAHRIARLGRPFARHVQRRFARDSLAAMTAAVSGDVAPGRGRSLQ
jgi:uncharacterized protein (UPF0548 family)